MIPIRPFLRVSAATAPRPRDSQARLLRLRDVPLRSGAEEARRVPRVCPVPACVCVCVRPALPLPSLCYFPATRGVTCSALLRHPRTHVFPVGVRGDACSGQRCARCQPLGGRGARRRRLWRRPGTIRSGMRNESVQAHAPRPAATLAAWPVVLSLLRSKRSEVFPLTRTRSTALPCEPLWTACAPSDSVVNRASEFGDRVGPHGCDAFCPAGVCPDVFRCHPCWCYVAATHVPRPATHRRASSAYGTYRCGGVQRTRRVPCLAMRCLPTFVAGRSVSGPCGTVARALTTLFLRASAHQAYQSERQRCFLPRVLALARCACVSPNRRCGAFGDRETKASQMLVTASWGGAEVAVEVDAECRSVAALKRCLQEALPEVDVEAVRLEVCGRPLDDEGVLSLVDGNVIEMSATQAALAAATLRREGCAVDYLGFCRVAERGDVLMCKRYLEAGVIWPSGVDNPLHIAVRRGYGELCELLLDSGCDKDEKASKRPTRTSTGARWKRVMAASAGGVPEQLEQVRVAQVTQPAASSSAHEVPDNRHGARRAAGPCEVEWRRAWSSSATSPSRLGQSVLSVLHPRQFEGRCFAVRHPDPKCAHASAAPAASCARISITHVVACLRPPACVAVGRGTPKHPWLRDGWQK